MANKFSLGEKRHAGHSVARCLKLCLAAQQRWICRREAAMSDINYSGERPAAYPAPKGEVSTSVSAQPSGSEQWWDLAPDAIVGLSEQWEILFANRAAKEMFPGDGPIEIGKPAWQWPALLTVLGSLHLDRLKSASNGEGFRTLRATELARKGGALSLEVSISISGEVGRRIFVLVFRDVSHQRPAESKLYQSQKQQVVGALAGGIAHDFNNILTAVICRIDLVLGNRELPENARDNLVHAVESARRGAELNTKLLSFSRRAATQPLQLDVARLVDETVFILRRSIDRRIQIHVFPPPKDLWRALGDEDQFMQVMMNLCLNARDAMPEGGNLAIECANCTFDSQNAKPPRHPGEFVRISVSDTGHGMAPEVLSRLFEPYFSTKGFGKGAGLGLSIANHVVVEHGGWMEVESEQQKGSRFHVFLPRTTSASPAPKLKEHKIDGGSVLKGTETILLVDDETSIRSVMMAALSFRGFRVLEAKDGEEAMQHYRQSMRDIDLVLLDLQMPRMNGWDTMDQILALNPRARIVLLSGGSPVPPRPGAMDRALGILMKPFESVQLLRAIREALDDRKIS